MDNTEINSNNQSKWHALLVSFLFISLFWGLFIFEASLGELWPTGDIDSLTIKDLFEKYYIYTWFIVAVLSSILFFILNIFTRYIKYYKLSFQLLLIGFSLLPWYIFANQMVFHENRYADFAKAIISYIWYPLLVTITDFVIVLAMLLASIQIILFFKIMLLWKK
jgi:hypothetical protein